LNDITSLDGKRSNVISVMNDGDNLILDIRARHNGHAGAVVTSSGACVAEHKGQEPLMREVGGQVIIKAGEQDVLIASINALGDVTNSGDSDIGLCHGLSM
jgi:hypothetical protein